MSKQRARSAKKRKQQLVKNMLLVVVGFAFAITLLGVGNSRLSTKQVQASKAYDEQIYYKSVMINEGDSLWTIADEYMSSSYKNKNDYIEEVLEINQLNETSILKAGSYIMVPYSELVTE